MPRLSLGHLTHSHLESKQPFLGSPPGVVSQDPVLPVPSPSSSLLWLLSVCLWSHYPGRQAQVVFCVTFPLNLDLLEWGMTFYKGLSNVD